MKRKIDIKVTKGIIDPEHIAIAEDGRRYEVIKWIPVNEESINLGSVKNPNKEIKMLRIKTRLADEAGKNFFKDLAW